MNDIIGFSTGSLLKSRQVIEFASVVDKNESVDSIWVPESWGKEAFSTLGAISQVTDNLKIGTSIINIYSRTPATIAMGAITLDNLSNNRVIIGLGTSTSTLVENLHGMKFENPLMRMKEYIKSIRLLMQPFRISYSGQIVKITNFKLLEHSRVNIPIYIAAVNIGMINLANKYADGIIFYLKSKEELEEVLKNINGKLLEQEFKRSLVIITSVSNRAPEKAMQRAAKTLAFYISVGNIYYKSLLQTNYKPIIEKIYRDYHNFGMERSISNITQDMLKDFVVAGSVNDCRYQIKQIRKIGINLPILQVNPIEDSNGNLIYKDFYEL